MATTGKTKVMGLSDLMTLLLTWVFILQTEVKSIQKHTSLIKNRFSRWKVIQNSIDWLWGLLTRRWNAWYSERHSAFTAGGEMVMTAIQQMKISLSLLCTLPPLGSSILVERQPLDWKGPRVESSSRHLGANSLEVIVQIFSEWDY
jgi:hypothetical protein